MLTACTTCRPSQLGLPVFKGHQDTVNSRRSSLLFILPIRYSGGFGLHHFIPTCCCASTCDRCHMTQSEIAVHPAGSGRSFTAYVFVKSDKAQHAQRASLVDASAAQPLSPQSLTAQKIIAKSPSPIATPHIAAASRLPLCHMPACSQAGSAVAISVIATAGVVEPTVCTDACTDQAEACDMRDRSCDAHEPREASTDQRDAKALDHYGYGTQWCCKLLSPLDVQNAPIL